MQVDSQTPVPGQIQWHTKKAPAQQPGKHLLNCWSNLLTLVCTLRDPLETSDHRAKTSFGILSLEETSAVLTPRCLERDHYIFINTLSINQAY